jgi:hypothetical protein
VSLVDQVGLDAYRRLLLRDRIVRDPSTSIAWMVALDAGIAALVASLVPATSRASVVQAAPFTLAAGDKGATDKGSGTYSVTVPAASTLGDPWSYEMIVASGVVTFARPRAAARRCGCTWPAARSPCARSSSRRSRPRGTRRRGWSWTSGRTSTAC